MATRNVVATPDMDKTFIIRWSDWIYDLFFTLIENDVKQTIKRGDYTPDTTSLANGGTLPKLNKKQRLELLEYRKTL